MKDIKYIHVAGTNGKGSTCHYIAHGLRSMGYRVGLFTSPHLLCPTERIVVDGVPIPLERVPPLTPDRFFQELWQAALEYFTEQTIDYAVIETGIGGLLDCTNETPLVRRLKPPASCAGQAKPASLPSEDVRFVPVLSVITKIGLDHTALLGGTIAEIAVHKAGIIKEGVPVITDPTQADEAMAVIRETAAAKNAELTVAGLSDNAGLPCPFGQNKLIAAAALHVLFPEKPGDSVYDFEQVKIPGRMQLVRTEPSVIIDGAHNPDAIRAIVPLVVVKIRPTDGQSPSFGLISSLALAARMPSSDKIIIFGTQKSKDCDGCLRELAPLAPYTLVKVNDVSDYNETCAAIERALAQATRDDLILICGSMYLAGNALRYFSGFAAS
ncbi:MAG: hypothetical protein FWD35_04600 [Oscillospiraceae bacterium]|nr:hypothetical protein [Oscillospiraceae bacterium]